MMFRKLHTTGLNKGIRAIAALLAALVLFAMPFGAAAEEEKAAEYSISVSGFDFELDPADDYYLINPERFDNCVITAYAGFKSLKVSVEQYAGHYPYLNKTYKLGDPLELGHGRAKVTLTVTLADGSAKDYRLIFTDPEALENCYAKVVVNKAVNLREKPSTSSKVLLELSGGITVYYLGTEGDWAKIQYVKSTKSNGVLTKTTSYVGYVKDTAEENYIRWNWEETKMPPYYAEKIEALKKAHPNWSFTFVDTGRTFEETLQLYGASREQYINPFYYLNEDKIFAFLDIDTYDPECWTDEGVKAIWATETTYTKEQALAYFKPASLSLQMNPYYIACRAALESGYGGSKFAKGQIEGYEGYYNFFGIKCYDRNPSVGAQYAKERDWNTVEISITEGANWIKDQYLDRGAVTPYFFRYSGFWSVDKVYMTDAEAPSKEAEILKRAYSDPDAKAHFIIPVYQSPFSDLDPSEWYYQDTIEAVEAGIFNGMSETEFAPMQSITRAQFVTALSRLCGADVSTYELDKFEDIKGQWHYNYVAWAYAVGVTEGVSETAFDPDREITRQEMCKMLGNAIENVMGKKLEAADPSAAPKQYADQDSVDSWAAEWVEKCSAAGIFKGDDKGNFNPRNNALRCEAATVFNRCHQKFAK